MLKEQVDHLNMNIIFSLRERSGMSRIGSKRRRQERTGELDSLGLQERSMRISVLSLFSVASPLYNIKRNSSTKKERVYKLESTDFCRRKKQRQISRFNQFCPMLILLLMTNLIAKQAPIVSAYPQSPLQNSNISPMSKSSSIGSNRNYQDRNESKSNNSSPATETKSSLVQVYEHEHYSKITNSWQGGRGPDSVEDFEKEPSSPVHMQRWTSSSTNHGSNVKILPPPSELSAPKGYKYISEWKIDVGKDEKDELGWEYYVSKGVGRRRRRWLRTVEIVVIEKKQEEKEVKKEDDYYLNVKAEKIRIASDTFSPPKSSLVGMRPYFIARLLKELSDSFNFKGFGASANKSLLSKWGMGCGCRIPISANFGFFEARPYLPLITAVVGFYYPLRFAVFVNASLPVELLRTGVWQCLDYMVWMMSMIYFIIWKFLITDFITKGVLINSVKVMSKLLALEPSAMKDDTQDRYGKGESSNGEESKVTQSEEGSKRNNIGENDRKSESTNSDKSSLLVLGREFPALPKRRSVLYNPGISDRVGMNIGVHVSKRRGVEIRWHWWHVYNPTIEYMQTKYSEIKDSLIKTSQSSKAIPTLPIWLTEKFASLGVTWGGFNPEPPHYSGSAVFSLSGLYPLEAIRKMRENRIERVARQTVEKQLGAKLKRKKDARLKEEEYEEIRQVKVGAS